LDQLIAWRSPRNELLAVMTIEEIGERDLVEAAEQVSGRKSRLVHPQKTTRA
jgi:hypothetical protein